ncbi:proline-specific peptidase [Mycena metata]|uniref:Proline-specific peptidase n=1 Tax=Mycena metata TaxID=1033252 RepID=A0AAD7J5L8_9AGAR|nr:proline-specific peptidase [Mycena metata]KAJ7767168.1 proline-specific peptidase [Mycena metata]
MEKPDSVVVSPCLPQVETGYIDHFIAREPIRTWFKIIGELGTACPVIILHGGPGFSHSYTLPHTELHATWGIPVIFYDQLGCGASTHPNKGPEFWTLDVFMDQLDAVITHFGVAGRFSLLGHAWGGMLAATYAARRRPPGLQRLVLTNCPASMELWAVGTNALLATFPLGTRTAIEKHESAGTIDAQEYQDAMQRFNETHLCTLKPWPTELLQSFTDLLDDPRLYLTMNGPSEFKISGTLKSWSIVDELPEIRCQTLVINGLGDMAQDIAVAPFFHTIPRCKWIQLRSSTHMPFFEEPVRYFNVVGDFLSSA